jgi:hypothetical protein
LWRDIVARIEHADVSRAVEFFLLKRSGEAGTDAGSMRSWVFVPAIDLLLTVGEGLVGITADGLFVDSEVKFKSRLSKDADIASHDEDVVDGVRSQIMPTGRLRGWDMTPASSRSKKDRCYSPDQRSSARFTSESLSKRSCSRMETRSRSRNRSRRRRSRSAEQSSLQTRRHQGHQNGTRSRKRSCSWSHGRNRSQSKLRHRERAREQDRLRF